jgi:ABC-type multidrug transport system permease subunit
VTSLKRNTVKQHPLWMLTVMRWRIFSREPSTIFWTYAFPLLLAFALGIAFRNRPPEPVEAAVQIGPGAERLRDTLSKNPTVHVRWLDAEKAQEALRTGRVSVVVVDGSPRTYRFDPTRPESRIARAVVDDVLQRAEGRTDPTQVSDQLVTEPGSRYIDFLIPGLLGFNLMSSGLWGVGFVIVEMRTRKLIKRMVATPMRKTHFLLSFVLMRAVFLLGELPILLAFAYYMFHVPIRGSIPLIVGLATLGSLMFAGMGLLVASRAQNTQTVGGLVNLMILPMSICSGVFFSSAKFPDFLQPAIKLMPLTALIDSVREVMLDGAGAAQVARPIAIMTVWGLVAFLAALKLFRWR